MKTPMRIAVNEALFKEALRTGRYEYWTPFHDGQEVGEEGVLVEHGVNIEVEIVCMGLRPSKDGFWTAVWGIVGGPVKL